MNKKVTYTNMVCDYRPLKKEIHHVCLTIGGNFLSYCIEASSSSLASHLETKLISNSTIPDATQRAKFFGVNTKDFFLQTHLPKGEQECIQVH
eukprot:11431779-Ditylum_brightwellii.AAC.1